MDLLSILASLGWLYLAAVGAFLLWSFGVVILSKVLGRQK
jgi:hypothetical protein